MKLLRTILTFCLFLASASPARSEDALPPATSAAGPDLADVFDFSRAARPKPGDWLEYLIAFPVDPLESSLEQKAADTAPNSAASAADSEPLDYEALAMQLRPEFDPPAAWRSVPVRIVIREVFPDGCNADIRFADGSSSVRLSAGDGARAQFHYDAGGESERGARVGDREYTVREQRRSGAEYGFVRWFSEEIPFGIVRFATESVDIQLVAAGRGAPPDEFPVRLTVGIAPALGSLY